MASSCSVWRGCWSQILSTTYPLSVRPACSKGPVGVSAYLLRGPCSEAWRVCQLLIQCSVPVIRLGKQHLRLKQQRLQVRPLRLWQHLTPRPRLINKLILIIAIPVQVTVGQDTSTVRVS